MTERTQDSPKVPGGAISADDLITVLEQALDAEAQLPTPESAGFETNAIRDFLTFVQAHGGFDVPTGPTGIEPVHFGSLMGGLTIGAVAARQALLSALLSDEVVEAAGKAASEQHYFRPYDRITRTILQAAIEQVGGGQGGD